MRRDVKRLRPKIIIDISKTDGKLPYGKAGGSGRDERGYFRGGFPRCWGRSTYKATPCVINSAVDIVIGP